MPHSRPTSGGRSGSAGTFDRLKEFEGRRYTGMRVGRRHKWYYDQGEWNETKVTPDRWQFTYGVTKRRAGHAPEGSGAPVDTEYHWYLLADQTVRKVSANEYTTSMVGAKFKLAHKRADTQKWSASPAAQRRQLIRLLQGMIDELQGRPDIEPVLPAVAAGGAPNGGEARRPVRMAAHVVSRGSAAGRSAGRSVARARQTRETEEES